MKNSRKNRKAVSTSKRLSMSADALIALNPTQDYTSDAAMSLQATMLAEEFGISKFRKLLVLRENMEKRNGLKLPENVISQFTQDVEAELKNLGVEREERVIHGLLDLVIGTLHMKMQTARKA